MKLALLSQLMLPLTIMFIADKLIHCFYDYLVCKMSNSRET